MFLARRPSSPVIDRFLQKIADLPLSYNPVGIALEPGRRRLDEMTVAIGRGRADFERARAALIDWKQCNFGWVETFPKRSPVAVGTVLAVLIRHMGFWSLNGCRVVYHSGGSDSDARFGVAYGTLVEHAEGGEELFEVFMDASTGHVMYRIRATSWPRAVLARVGQPMVRVLQERFRRDSAAMMKLAIAEGVRR